METPVESTFPAILPILPVSVELMMLDPLEILLSENFNGSLYGMTQEESATVRALRQVVTQYNRTHSSDRSQPVTDSQ